MTVTNKMVLSQFDFNMNFLLLAFQASGSLKRTESASAVDMGRQEEPLRPHRYIFRIRKDRGPILIVC